MEGRGKLGRVIVSRSFSAQTPYFLPEISKNIYSLEELCYYFFKNAYILDRDIMNDDLIDWIEFEQDSPDLAKVLRNQLKKDAPLSDFVSMIMKNVALYRETDIDKVTEAIRENAKLDINEKHKKRADFLAKDGMYAAAIREYEGILNLNTKKDYVLCSSVYNNIGYCYAGMFMYSCAAQYFEKAYKINGKNSCLLQYMAALKLSLSPEEYRNKVLTDLKTVQLEEELEAKFGEQEALWQESSIREELIQLAENGRLNKSMEYYEQQEAAVNRLVEEFRKSENESV